MDIVKLEEMLYESDLFIELKNRIQGKQRTIFNIIVKDSDELTFSRTLKYFLDPNESHNLNDYFLREFLYKIALADKKTNISRLYFDSIDLSKCNVSREFPIKSYGRIDIFIELNKEFALIIENKLYSDEGVEQTKRYETWAHKEIKQHYNHLLFCYLTPDGRQAESEKFISVSINDIIPIFKNKTIEELLNNDNRFLFKHFSKWMEELNMTDDELKKLCQSIYRKYKGEIKTIMDYAPTITSYVKDIANQINKKNTVYFAHSGKDWLTISPKKWMDDSKLKESSKYSKIRLEYNYFDDSKNFHISLVFPNKNEFINLIKNKSKELFGIDYNNTLSWNNWGNKYISIQKWESFDIDNYIDAWDNNIKEFSVQIIEKMDIVDKILSDELENKITVANTRS